LLNSCTKPELPFVDSVIHKVVYQNGLLIVLISPPSFLASLLQWLYLTRGGTRERESIWQGT
jgi:hypothetical protein